MSIAIAAASETYLEVERLIDKCVWNFVKKYGGNFEDLRADANLSYVKAFNCYDPTRGVTFASHVWTWVWDELLDAHRTYASRLNKTGPIARGDAVNLIPDRHAQSSNWVEDFMEEISEDARTVVSLCLSTPQELAQIAEAKGGTPRNVRSTIRDFLSATGWSYDRIKESFEEIKIALS